MLHDVTRNTIVVVWAALPLCSSMPEVQSHQTKLCGREMLQLQLFVDQMKVIAPL